MEVIIRNRPVGDRLADLGLDSAQSERAKEMIRELVEESFGEQRDHYPEKEARERIRVLWRWFCIMYADLGYTLRRCREHLPSALACEMMGMTYGPPEDVTAGYRVRKRGEIPWTQL